MEAKNLFDSKSVISGASVPQTIRDENFAGALVRKWDPLLKGVDNPHTRATTAYLYENQSRYLKGTAGYLTEETRAAATGPFTKFVFPIIRRVFPNLIANAIVSVQPMSSPVGAIFFFRYRFGTTKGGITAGDEAVAKFDRFYSSETVSGETLATGNGVALAFSVNADFTPVRASSVVVTTTIAGPTAVKLTDNGAGALATSPASGNSGTINYATGEVSLTFAAAVVSATAISVTYDYNSELNPTIPQMNIDVELLEIKAKTRKLKALWSSEASDDLRALQGMDIESELVAEISSEIAIEIDREIINDLLTAAQLGDPFFGTNITNFDAKAPASVDKYTHIRSVILAINAASENVHKFTRRAPANWMVISPEVASLVDSLPFFQSVDASQYTYTGTIVKIGTLKSKWTVYKDPFHPTATAINPNTSLSETAHQILLGYQGPSFLDTGYVYAPYIPLQVTPTFMDPADMTFRKGIRTRYGKKLVRPEFYALTRIFNTVSL